MNTSELQTVQWFDAATIQKGQWFDALNLQIIPFESRPDAARWVSGPIYRITQVFNTREGSWEPGSLLGSIDQWAVDAWWSGTKWKGAGGAQHFFIMVLDEAGVPMPGKGLMWWQGEMTPTFKPSDTRDAWTDGTENLPVYSSYMPERGEQGAWSGCTVGRSDLLKGVGLPGNCHVSTFVVLQAVSMTPVPDPDPKPSTDIQTRIAVALESLAKRLGA